MSSGKNVLVVIVALLVSAQGVPTSLGRGSYTYDPDSIVQNERILRLFIRLASETANHLIHLKNEAIKVRRESTSQVNDSEPVLRMQFPDVDNDRRIVDHENGITNVTGVLDSKIPFQKSECRLSSKDPGTSNEPTTVPSNAGSKSDEMVDRDHQALTSISQSETTVSGIALRALEPTSNIQSGPKDTINEAQRLTSSGKNESEANDHRTLQRGSNSQPEFKGTRSEGNFIESAIGQRGNEAASMANQGFGLESNIQNQLQNVTKEFQELASSGQNESQSAESAKPAFSPESKLQLQSKEMISSLEEPASSRQNGSQPAGNAKQPFSQESMIQSESNGMISSLEEPVLSGQKGSQPTGYSKPPFGQESKIQSESKGMIGSLQEPAASGQSGSQPAGNAKASFSPESKIQFGSMGLIGVFEESGSSEQNGNETAGMVNPIVAAASNIHQLPTARLSTLAVVHDGGLGLLSGNISTGNLANQTITSMDRNLNLKNSESVSPSETLVPNELSSLPSSPNAMNLSADSGYSPLINPNQAIASIANVLNGTSLALVQSAQHNGPKIFEQIHDPALPVAQTSTGKIGNALGDLTNAGSLVFDKGTGTIANIGSSIKPDNLTSVLTGTDIGGMPGIGSRLLGSLPLFRAFPSDESRRNDNDTISVTERIKEHRNAEDPQAYLDQSNVVRDWNFMGNYEVRPGNSTSKESDDEIRLTEMELQNFANQIVDALRPLDSGQKVKEQPTNQMLQGLI